MGARLLRTGLLVFGLSLIGASGISGTARALTVTGSTSVAFSNPDCSLFLTCNVLGSGGATLFEFGTDGDSSLLVEGQSIGPTDTDFTAIVAALTWTNNDETSIFGSEYDVDLTITFNMIVPTGQDNTGALPINIEEVFTFFPPTNGPDIITLPDLSALSFTFAGGVLGEDLTIDNFQYSAPVGADRRWVTLDGSTTSINILADFSAEPIAPIPLPATLPLYASGLGLMALFGWWRRRRGCGCRLP